MNLLILQAAIKNGYTINVSSSDDFKMDNDFLRYLREDYVDLDDLCELIAESTETHDDEYSCFTYLIKELNHWEKERTIRTVHEHSTEYLEKNLDDIDPTLYIILMELMESEEISYDDYDMNIIFDFTIKANTKKTLELIMKLGVVCNEEMLDTILDTRDYLIPTGWFSSSAFIDSVNDLPATSLTGNIFESKKHYKAGAYIVSVLDKFELTEDTMNTLFSKLYGIGDYEDLDNLCMGEEVSRINKEDKLNERKNNRITIEDAEEYLKENKFTVSINVREGGIHFSGEDMDFDTLIIDGTPQSQSANGRGGESTWYRNRDFGDHKMSKDWFLESVNKFKKN